MMTFTIRTVQSPHIYTYIYIYLYVCVCVVCVCVCVGTAVAQWLRFCATNRKVAGSIPAGVNGIFHWRKILPIALWPWGRLSLEQKWVPGVFHGGKGGRCVRLTTYHHPVPLSWNLKTLTSWNPLGLQQDWFTFIYIYIYIYIYMGTVSSTVIRLRSGRPEVRIRTWAR